MPLDGSPPYFPAYGAGAANVDNARVDLPSDAYALPAGTNPGGHYDDKSTPQLPTRLTADAMNDITQALRAVCAAGGVTNQTHLITDSAKRRTYLLDAINALITQRNASYTADVLWQGMTPIVNAGIYSLNTGKTFATPRFIVCRFESVANSFAGISGTRRYDSMGLSDSNYWVADLYDATGGIGDDIGVVFRVNNTQFRFWSPYNNVRLRSITGVTV